MTHKDNTEITDTLSQEMEDLEKQVSELSKESKANAQMIFHLKRNIADIEKEIKNLKSLYEQERKNPTRSKYKKTRRRTFQRPRRANTMLSEIGILPGDILNFKNDLTISCKVLNDRKVEYQGKEYYLTTLARKILHEKYGVSDKAATSGCHHFKFEGKTLYDLRNAYALIEEFNMLEQEKAKT